MTAPDTPLGILPEMGDPPPVQGRVGVTSSDSAGRSYVIFGLATAGGVYEVRLTAEAAESLGTNIGPALRKAAQEAKRRSSGIVTPPSGFIIPNGGSHG